MSNSITHSPVVLYHTQINTSSYNSPGCIEIAKDFLSGYHGDYYYFQSSEGYYILILCDNYEYSSLDGNFRCEDAIVYDIFIESDSSTQLLDFSGSASGSFAGVSPSPSAGDWSGSVSGSTEYDTINYEYFYTIRSVNIVSLYNPDHRLVYSSLDGFPKLVGGVTYYAFAAFALCFGIIGFKLLDRIFRRIY